MRSENDTRSPFLPGIPGTPSLVPGPRGPGGPCGPGVPGVPGSPGVPFIPAGPGNPGSPLSPLRPGKPDGKWIMTPHRRSVNASQKNYFNVNMNISKHTSNILTFCIQTYQSQNKLTFKIPE